jgi:ABC-2 type transport system permease protein
MTSTNVHHQPPRAHSLIVHQCRYDLRAFRRDRQAGVTTVVMPLVLLVAFVGLAGHHSSFVQDGHKISVAQFYVPGLIAFAVVASSFASLLIDLVTLRQSGILKRRRATPVPAWALIGGRTLCCAVLVLGTSAALLFLGRNNYNVHFASVLLPDSKNPEVLRQIARAFPLEHIASGLHRAFSVTSPGIGMTATDLAVLAAWIAVGLAVAIQRFQWLPR